MANYYEEVSFVVELTPAEREFACALAGLISEYGDLPLSENPESVDFDTPEESFLVESYQEFTEHDSWGLGCLIEPHGETGLWVHADESADIEGLALFFELIARAFNWPKSRKIGFEWASTCSKHRLDSFGGGAVVVNVEGSEWLNTGRWLDKHLASQEDTTPTEAFSVLDELVSDIEAVGIEHVAVEWSDQAVDCLLSTYHKAKAALSNIQNKYTVIILYPPSVWPDEDSPEVYIEYTNAPDAKTAIDNVKKVAEAANHGSIGLEEFKAIAVYRGFVRDEIDKEGLYAS